MEQLSLQDNHAEGAAPNAHPPPIPQQVPQLPPQMFTTAAQLLDLTDTNLVLQDTVERIFVNHVYADIQRGIFIVRGENVLLLGEIDLDKDDYIPEPFQQASAEQVFMLQKKEQDERKRVTKRRNDRLQALGFEGENAGEVLL
ncbi:MAG: SM-like, degradation of cytoplasmic mRNAs and positively regulates transcription initiation [Sclerophora amabilis]|nr:MAG: SM-like, degradation of cytoplasmic mRNAs and positively regulates transcription initiation [Sclerophora amabilis]